MKLKHYLIMHQMTPAEFARQLGVTSRTTIHRYVNGERMPSPEMMRKIYDATNGEVTPNDFYQWAQKPDSDDREPPWRVEPPEPDPFRALEKITGKYGVSRPVAYALQVLGHRARVLPRGVFQLEGKRVDARAIVAAANVILDACHLPIIAYPGVTEPDDPRPKVDLKD